MRQQTVTMNERGFSMSKVIPEVLGDIVNFSIDNEKKQIIIDNSKGSHIAIISYPYGTTPRIDSIYLVKWIEKELGYDLDYSCMPVTWEGNRAIVQPGELFVTNKRG